MLFGPGGGGGWSDRSASDDDPYPAQLYDLAEDLGATANLYAERPDGVDQGRSNSGPPQANDVPLNWARFTAAAAGE
mgnify:CR=1 FL=1